jgi:ABC-type transport system substrate-binding protein
VFIARTLIQPFLLVFVFLFVALSVSLCYAARDNDTIVIVQGVDPTTLDPMNHLETPALNLCLNIYDTLLQRDANVKIEPLLAESYKLLQRSCHSLVEKSCKTISMF